MTYYQFAGETIEQHYKDICTRLQKKIIDKESLRVAFIIQLPSALMNIDSIFHAMLCDPLFEPMIILTIDAYRHQSSPEVYTNLYAEAKERYGDYVLHGYDTANNKDIEHLSTYDIIWFTNPYLPMQTQAYSIISVFSYQALPIYGDYSFNVLHYTEDLIRAYTFYELLWLYLTDSQKTLLSYKTKQEGLQRDNAEVSYFYRMDSLATTQRPTPHTTTVLITLHHSVIEETQNFSLATFLDYATYFLRLPERYPTLNFIFRPHPVLWFALEHMTTWTKEMTKEYITTLTSHPNLRYSEKGNYFEDFVESDAIINDCASFTFEYLFTEKPGLFLFRNEDTKLFFNDFGQECLQCYYHAYQQQDIDAFIDNIVLPPPQSKHDTLAGYRHNFISQYRTYYPHTSSYILERIKIKIEHDSYSL